MTAEAGEDGLGYATRGRLEKLFEAASPDADPEGLLTRFVHHVLLHARIEESFARTGPLTERLKALHWYLTAYGERRPMGLPISARQIAFLNAPMPMLGLAREVSVAAYSFIVSEKPNLDLNDEEGQREALFWWCTERSLALAPAGELITPSQVRILTQTAPQDVGARFPLNYFVRKTYETDASLGMLDLRATLDRAVLAAALLLRSVAKPFMAQFLSPVAVAELTRDGAQGMSSTIEGMLAVALGEDGGAVAQARELARLLAPGGDRYRPLVSKARTGAAAHHAGPCFARAPSLRSGWEPGLAVIGPVRAGSGLGQAMRLSIDTLKSTGRDVAVIEFGLDNPAPIVSATPVRAPSAARRINLLHLNADMLPLAWAFLDERILERSYNIGFFFWELDQVPDVQRLALDLVDEIWVASEYNRNLYSRTVDVPVHNVGLAAAPLPELGSTSRRTFGLDEEACIFLATFDSFSFVERKNPHGVIDAFRAAFPLEADEPVQLVLKTHNRTRVGDPHHLRVWQAIDDAVARDPRIHVVDQTLSYTDLLRFKKVCDAYVSLHRSEGWGFGLMEAMQLGVPVIATGYSGNMDFCSPETAFLVDYDLVPTRSTEYAFVERGSRWAAPSTSSAAAAMRAVFDNPHHGRTRAEAARRRITDSFSLPASSRRYDARLIEIQAFLEPSPSKQNGLVL